MADTNFVDGVTIINANWLNDINNLNYTLLSNPSTTLEIAEELPLVTQTTVGTMSTTDKIKLDNLSGGGGGYNLLRGNFFLNQREVSGTVILAVGEYGHDRFRGGSSGCSYTFATSENTTTITIATGSLEQEVEGDFLLSGTHVLSWQGTSQGRIDGGSFGTSGNVTATDIIAV